MVREKFTLRSDRVGRSALFGRVVRSARSVRWLAGLAVALLLSGCVTWAEDGTRPGIITGRATVEVGGYTFPLLGARVSVPAGRSIVSTDRTGRYTYRRLPVGHHSVTLSALHGTYMRTVYIEDEQWTPQTVNWPAQARGINPDTFFHLSGLKTLWLDERGRSVWDYATLVRWEKRIITVYFDEDNAPWEVPRDIVQRYFAELERWQNRLQQRVRFVRTRDEAAADIAVYWVPYLGDYAGIARHVAFYANGALKRVEIEIEGQYAKFPGLWEHEFAHAMGVDHVRDQRSVMHPQLYGDGRQRTTFSEDEWKLVRLLYDIPSGQRLPGGRSYGAMVVDDDMGTGTLPGDGDAISLDGGDPISFDGGSTIAGDGAHVVWDLDVDSELDVERDADSELDVERDADSDRDGSRDAYGSGGRVMEATPADGATGQREHTLYVDPAVLEAWLQEQFAEW